MKTLIASLLQEYLSPLPAQLEETEKGIRLRFDAWKDLHWKGQPVSITPFAPMLRATESVILEANGIMVPTGSDGISLKNLHRLCETLSRISDMIAKDNPHALSLWGRYSTLAPRGFDETQPSASKALLDTLYADRYIVKEKKAFIIDLGRSSGAYMVSADPEPRVILDAASQIASLAVGFNHVSKNPMLLRPELYETHRADRPFPWNQWDVAQAYTDLLKRESGLPYPHFVNSGAEGIETAIRACQSKYPNRRRILSFEGSFHGRTLLSLHCTHSPEKRAPFEIFPGTVTFNPFPETKRPELTEPEPKDWISTWAAPEAANFQAKIDAWLATPPSGADFALLKNEIQCLLQARESLRTREFLATIIEPMQCEGGDRYGTARFFRALRVMTRAFDTPMIIDEVQTGFGLGGPFFWFRCFNLVQANGEPDLPDALVAAKKAQIGVCLTTIPWMKDHPIDTETSPASLYRGYLQAQEVLQAEAQGSDKKIEEKTRLLLHATQKTLGQELIQNPRAQSYAFAFDLPDAEILKKLIERRFPNGVLFYPAGDRTARFRLMCSTSDRELVQIFRSITQCFLDLGGGNTYLRNLPSISTWESGLPQELRAYASAPETTATLPWEGQAVPKSRQEYFAVTQAQWIDWFSILAKHLPELLRSPHNARFNLSTLSSQTRESLWKHYEEQADFTWIDLLWQSARAFGFRTRVLTSTEVEQLRDRIDELEKTLYEPARQDDPDMFVRVSKDPGSLILAAFGDDQRSMIGFCAAAPLKHFENIDLVHSDPQFTNPNALYSIDLSVAREHQGRGLGFRLKAEQYIEALNRGCEWIRSRNRSPEAAHMSAVNRQFGAVVIKRNTSDYGGTGTALYQSIRLNPSAMQEPAGTQRSRVCRHPYTPALKNKVSLANFVSRSYVNTLLLLKETLPAHLRHLYLASSRAEGVDKMIKLLRSKRPKARVAISYADDFFGDTTACARSLGGNGKLSYFQWPRLQFTPNAERLAKELREEIARSGPDAVLGVFVEPFRERTGERKDPAHLRAIIEAAHAEKVPVLFQETASAFRGYDANRFFCASDTLKADGLMAYPGGQLSLLAVSDELFLEKALMMISTWDGDEHSLNLLRERLLAEA